VNITINVGLDTAVILERLDQMASEQQTQIDALAAQVETSTAAITTAVDGIRQDIADLLAANPTLDLTALTAKVDALGAAAAAATELDSENPVPPVG
jgi:hypothetical protein